MFPIDIDQYMDELSTPKLSKGMTGIDNIKRINIFIEWVLHRDTRWAIGDEMGERWYIQLLIFDGFESSRW